MKRVFAITFCTALLSTLSAEASPITFTFDGVINGVYDTITAQMHPVPGTFLGHPFAYGDTFHGVYTIDSGAVDTNPADSHSGYFIGNSYFIQFSNGYSISGSAVTNYILNDYGSGIDQYYVSANGTITPSDAITLTHSVTGDTGTTTLSAPIFYVRDNTGAAFNSDQLITTGLDLSDFGINYFTFTLLSNHFENATGNTTPNVHIVGRLTSITASTPLPAGLPLFASGLGVLGLLGWRRKRKNAAYAA